MMLAEKTMESFFAERMKHVPRSFIRDILKVAVSPEIISFAGGLPNKKFFPVEALKESAMRILTNNPGSALQYSNTEGLPELREQIAGYYKQQGILIDPENILITTGSQQALDLIGKVFINEKAPVILEEPAYLGAIQAFSVFNPDFRTVPLESDGMNLEILERTLNKSKARLAYLVVNFQNPSGISYSYAKRKEIAALAIKHNLLLIEDDPYGLIRFSGKPEKSMYANAPENTLMLGTFSKTVVPGFRVGWIAAHKVYIEKLIIAKQAADLHTDIFAQKMIEDYLTHNSIQNHMQIISNAYGIQADAMTGAIKKQMGSVVEYTKPEGGMFLWMTLPEGCSSMSLFDLAIQQKLAFVPGFPFYINKTDTNTLRLNFSCSEPAEIEEGIKRLAFCLDEILDSRKE
jgi:2-aminoadipate transaminase